MIQEALNLFQEEAFKAVLLEAFPGAENTKDLLTDQWDTKALYHMWELPDNHISKVLVTRPNEYKIEVDELDHASFTYRMKVNTPHWINTSLCPNVIHSVDAYIVREMVRRCFALGVMITPIHDAFGAHPMHMNVVRQTYINIMSEIAKSTLLQDIIQNLGFKGTITKDADDLHLYIDNSEYMLS